MERKMKIKESKLKIASGGIKALSSYLKSGSEENDGVKGAGKTLDLSSTTLEYRRKALKRRRMKLQMRNYRDKIIKGSFKEKIISVIKEVKKVIVKNTKKVSIGVLSILILFIFIFQMSSILGGLFSNFNNGILSTTYLSYGFYFYKILKIMLYLLKTYFLKNGYMLIIFNKNYIF